MTPLMGCAMAALFAAAMASTAQAQTSPAPAAVTPNVQPAPASPVTSAPPQPQTQTAPPSSIVALPPQPPPPALPGPPTDEKRGFLNDFGKWWDQSIADFKTKIKDQQTKLDQMNKQSSDAAKDAASTTSQAMKDAANAMTHFSHVVEVQQTCPVAGNGAADCATAATNACKAKGYNTGQPLDVRTAEKCADSLWVSGQAPTRADCPVETVILRVACQ